MDFLEYMQMTEALNYIEKYLADNRCSDKAFDDMLDEFQIKNTVIGNKKLALRSFPYTSCVYSYGNGSTKEQLELIRGILLSAEYNYRKKELEGTFKETQTEDDIEKGTYDGKSLGDYEQLRLKAAEEIKNTNHLEKKLNYILQYGEAINKGLEKIAEYKLIKEAATNKKIIEITKRMTADGLSLSQISSCLETDVLSLYNLSKKSEPPL